MNKLLNNIVKYTSKVIKNINTKTIIIGFIILIICIIFIISNTLEYNLYTTKKNDKFVNINNNIKSYIVKFANNNNIDANFDIIYYNYFDRDLILQSITINTDSNNLEYLSNKDNIKEIYIQDSNINKYIINNFSISEIFYNIPPVVIRPVLNQPNVEQHTDDEKKNPNNPTTTMQTEWILDDIFSNIPLKSFIINCNETALNLPVNPMIGDNNNFFIIISYNNDNEIVLPFRIGEKRFRYNSTLINNDNDNDKIILKNYNENSKKNNVITPTHNTANNVTMQQFNKVLFKIEKPELQNIKKEFVENYIESKVFNYIENIKEFDKYIPYKFIINVEKLTNNNDVINIKPKYKLPNNGTFCLENNNNVNNNCILTINNILPDEDYILTILIEYRNLNDINNNRYSSKYELNFKIDSTSADNYNPEYDLLLSTIKNLNKYNFTNKMMTSLNIQDKFNKEQTEQDNKIYTLENNLETTFEKLNI